MIVEIRKAGFRNKGAELMLIAVVQKLKSRYPEAKIAMAPIYGGTQDTFERMSALKLYHKAFLWRRFFDFGRFAKIIPKNLRDIYGLVLSNEIDIVIDIAGFSYSDQWGDQQCKELSVSSALWKRNSTKLIMLPQAMGPYTTDVIKKYVARWVENADLIFTREFDSYKYLTDVVGEQTKIKLYPDFTNLLEGTLPPGFNSSDKKVAIVPNCRMIDKTKGIESQEYLPFLIRTARILMERNAMPFLLVHEGISDQILAEKVSSEVGGIPIVIEEDPLHIKGILGACKATVGSRFHGLVSALSQGVPSLATGWSHKYSRLFEDYDFLEGLVSVTDGDYILKNKIDLIINEKSSSELSSKLKARSEELKKKSEEMWDLVFSVIDSAQPQRRL